MRDNKMTIEEAKESFKKAMFSLNIPIAEDEDGDYYISISDNYGDRIWIDFLIDMQKVRFVSFDMKEISRWDVDGLNQMYSLINEINKRSAAQLFYAEYDDDYVGVSVTVQFLIPSDSETYKKILAYYVKQILEVIILFKQEKVVTKGLPDIFSLVAETDESIEHDNFHTDIDVEKIVLNDDSLGFVVNKNLVDDGVSTIDFRYHSEKFRLVYRKNDVRVILINDDWFGKGAISGEFLCKAREIINDLNEFTLNSIVCSLEDDQVIVSSKTCILCTDEKDFSRWLKHAIYCCLNQQETFLKELDYYIYRKGKMNK